MVLYNRANIALPTGYLGVRCGDFLAGNCNRLKAYIMELKERLETPKIVFLLHNCEPEDALKQFCRRLAEELHIVWITDAPVEPPIRAFSPGQSNLVEAVESWLEEFMLGNGE